MELERFFFLNYGIPNKLYFQRTKIKIKNINNSPSKERVLKIELNYKLDYKKLTKNP